jgi:hypothetical protein
VTDTGPVAQAIQAKIQRNLTGAQRLLLALEMSLAARELSLARLRRQHPEWSEAELRCELLRYSFAANDLPSPLR